MQQKAKVGPIVRDSWAELFLCYLPPSFLVDGPSVTDGLFKRDLRGIGRNGLQFSLCLARPVRRFRGSRKLDWGLRGFLVTLLRGCTTFAEVSSVLYRAVV
ncbi:hypothetical protein AVEN_60627-1 [Araneus ventricosus]|uniref:Uncharacterized protein n=1 Tax=Araneus ventricosus TaxID=182803 RepID=A0A4Y1ZK86_ARAVE|nr:hypothetical protein AVEN_207914-1 [Araneus ventricosus]GBL54928.1 hypothetical protein AVEN_60627-1 [Araneus ventricosus]